MNARAIRSLELQREPSDRATFTVLSPVQHYLPAEAVDAMSVPPWNPLCDTQAWR
jgi:hypothetical protein